MIPFMKSRYISLALSIAGIALSYYITFAVHGGFNLGIDFAGGIKLEIQESGVITLDSVKKSLSELQLSAGVQVADKSDSKLIKLELNAREEAALDRKATANRTVLESAGVSVNSTGYLRYALAKSAGVQSADEIVVVSENHVGPTIGEYLRRSATYVLMVSLALISVYIAFRFHFTFAVAAALALVHDLLFTIGLIGALHIPASVPVVAALLTILGYSINDTIVVFDRMREMQQHHEDLDFRLMTDKAINASLSRTILTSGTTLIAVLGFYFMGGEGLAEMAEVLMIGIFIGTYSSNFIAAPVLVVYRELFARR